ncbi:hypothetical protein PIB30_009453 [Stylosanthes scabra]|uniref:Uncharacterized protein n=1 Tax=Stylosanthes scabra TaxID=79078 RepID=A0ABU6X2K9_9FABA|nr:hypothetical protein [Stylosanthes scabra]
MVHHEVTNASDLKLFLDRNRAQIKERFNRESLLDLADCSLCTRSFDLWWSEYFSAHVEHIDSEFSNVILPTEKEKAKGRDHTPVASDSDREKKRDRGKAKASEPRKRSAWDLPKSSKALRIGDSSATPAATRVLRSRRLRTPFTNKETSPVRVDKGDGADDQDLELGQLLSHAKQVFSSGGRVAPGPGHAGGTSVTRPGSSVLLSKVVAKVLPFLDLPLEDLVASDQFRTELLDANSTLDEHLPVSEASLGKEFLDFISELCSVDISPLVAQKEELGKTCSGSREKSEQEMILKIEVLENELAAAKVGLDNIRVTNEGLSIKLDCYEKTNTLMVDAQKRAARDLEQAQEAYAVAEQSVKSLDDRRNRLKASLQRFI